MHRHALLLAGSALVAACAGPTEPGLEPGGRDAPTMSVAGPAQIAVAPVPATPVGERVTPAASPSAAIEDALARILPATVDEAIAKELRPLLGEALERLAADRRGTNGAAVDVLLIRLGKLGEGRSDPDLAAVELALESRR